MFSSPLPDTVMSVRWKKLKLFSSENKTVYHCNQVMFRCCIAHANWLQWRGGVKTTQHEVDGWKMLLVEVGTGQSEQAHFHLGFWYWMLCQCLFGLDSASDFAQGIDPEPSFWHGAFHFLVGHLHFHSLQHVAITLKWCLHYTEGGRPPLTKDTQLHVNWVLCFGQWLKVLASLCNS